MLLSVPATGLPAMILCLALLWMSFYSLDHKIEGTALVLLFWLGLSTATRDKVVQPGSGCRAGRYGPASFCCPQHKVAVQS